jgi:D-alanine-D-alanine ligase
MKKIKVGIIFGGKSAEHEISLQSAKNIFESIDKNKYKPILIGIDKSGSWFLINKTKLIKINKNSHFLINLKNNLLIELKSIICNIEK